MKKIIKSNIDYSVMRELGLSTLEIACYAAMDGEKGSYAYNLARRLERHSSNIYPALRRLEMLGLARHFKIEGYDSTWFRAIALEVAFYDFMEQRRKLLMPIMQAQRRREPLK